MATLFSCFTRVTSQSPCMHATLATAAITMRNSRNVFFIVIRGYPIKNADEFIGFVCGIVSQDHDLQEMYLDSFLKNAKLEGKDITDALHQLKDISEAYKINFVLSVSMDKEELPAEFQDDIIIAL